MLRTLLVAFAAMFISIQPAVSEEMDPDAAEDMGFYTSDYRGPIAPLNWDPDNSVVHPSLAYRLVDWLQSKYQEVSQDDDLRFAGHHMVLVEGCGGYLQCGAILDLTTGRPIVQLPTAGPGGYEFYSDCDLMGVHPPDMNSPDKETEIVFYRLTPNGGLVLLSERHPDCMTYVSHAAEN